MKKSKKRLQPLFLTLVIYCAIIGGIALSALLLIHTTSTKLASFAQTNPVGNFLAYSGCAMAHCDRTMSDNTIVSAPSLITALWHDTSVTGSDYGIGCSSNTNIVVCSFITSLGKPTTLKAYDAAGNSLWSSSRLNTTANYSAPIVDPVGGVIAADNTKVIKLRSDGNLVWSTNTPGGTPLSPTLTDNLAIILATLNGPISAYDATTGIKLGQRTIADTVLLNGQQKQGIFDTINTPAIFGNRIYIATQFRENGTGTVLPYGRLYAIDFARPSTNSGVFNIAWYYDFQAPSGSSPLLIMNNGIPTIYFDGKGVIPGGAADPHLFAIKDMGTTAELLWKYKMETKPEASAAYDPRGGLWVFAPFHPELIRLNQSTGTVLQRINVDTLVGQSGIHNPTSVMTITGNAENPVMLVSATPLLNQSSYILAINLVSEQVVWKYRVDEGKGANGVAYGQYPIAKLSNGKPVTVFTTKKNGVWGLGTK